MGLLTPPGRLLVWEPSWLSYSALTGQHCRDRTQPFFLNLELRQSLQVLDHFQDSENPSLRTPKGGWLALSPLPGTFREHPGTPWLAGTAPTCFYRREGWVFLCGFKGAACYQPTGDLLTKKPTTAWGRGQAKDLFMNSPTSRPGWQLPVICEWHLGFLAYHKEYHSVLPFGPHVKS